MCYTLKNHQIWQKFGGKMKKSHVQLAINPFLQGTTGKYPNPGFQVPVHKDLQLWGKCPFCRCPQKSQKYSICEKLCPESYERLVIFHTEILCRGNSWCEIFCQKKYFSSHKISVKHKYLFSKLKFCRQKLFLVSFHEWNEWKKCHNSTFWLKISVLWRHFFKWVIKI